VRRPGLGFEDRLLVPSFTKFLVELDFAHVRAQLVLIQKFPQLLGGYLLLKLSSVAFLRQFPRLYRRVFDGFERRRCRGDPDRDNIMDSRPWD
jgi:hypothetical protein